MSDKDPIQLLKKAAILVHNHAVDEGDVHLKTIALRILDELKRRPMKT